ncbi:2-oxo-4-hydroxy-4-carboxy-5-ureidoimidazoline decarboxylase [Alkalinema sp. FACHB-956]|uniref:2-oxo-4-hydroxy-4-carboxy-5-ureidoimidazoline decarboxylase n=1 Tax=Alkalinema sp. FACHB-956 TaxID=2692768 RepID=UPI001F549C1F|nr:2-oxo-4-hydroxy-4-carboxy-5-ureidoimidazoline decarboxylase [Alkalinema sp. FACHB-956]
MAPTYSLIELNAMSELDFIAALGHIFEQTPRIAQQAWLQRPFVSITDLHQKMVAIVDQLPPAQQIDLICAHPDLGSRAKMAEASVKEQAGVGLDQLTASEYDRFQALNQTYKAKFGFPFIIAVRNHTKTTILEAFEQRLQNTPEQEQQTALAEIATIAQFRLQDSLR